MTRSRELAELATAYDTGGLSSFKNRIINGDMRIDQRNAGASVTPTNAQYGADRWRNAANVASKFSVQQVSSAPRGFVYSTKATSLSAYSVGSGDLCLIQQFIEGTNVADLAWGTSSAATVTLSFWVQSSLTGTFGGSLQNSDRSRCYPFSYTISSANTWEQKTVTIAGDTTGTWLTTNGVGIQVNFGLGVGSTYLGTAGSWSGTTYFSATGATSVVGTNGATFYITGVQLEKGTTATSFDYRPYGTELALCQRYYETVGFVALDNVAFANIFYQTTKRAVPTLTKVSGGSTPSVNPRGSVNYFSQDGAVAAAAVAYSVSAEL